MESNDETIKKKILPMNKYKTCSYRQYLNYLTFENLYNRAREIEEQRERERERARARERERAPFSLNFFLSVKIYIPCPNTHTHTHTHTHIHAHTNTHKQSTEGVWTQQLRVFSCASKNLVYR